MSSFEPSSLRRGLVHYQRAVELDPEFVPAWAQLARAYSLVYTAVAPTSELAEQARQAVERARRLGPNRPETIAAEGTYHRFVRKDDRRALETFEAGLKLVPNDVELISGVAFLEQARGQWERAVALWQRAATLDPRSAGVARRLVYTLMALHRYPEAEAAQGLALALSPTDPNTLQQGAMLALAQGDRARAERIARNPPPGTNPSEQAYYFARYEELGWLLNDAQQRSVLALGPDAFGDDRAPWAAVLWQLHAMRGQPALARAYADSARMAYEANIAAEPNDPQRHVFLGLSLAFLGRKDEAIRSAERATELVPIERDAYFGPYVQMLAARVHMMVGNHDKAVELLGPVVAVPNNVTRDWLGVDPTWDPLRKHSGFQKLVEGVK
jgi:tetratricopeptide (TPR) repeat protein